MIKFILNLFFSTNFCNDALKFIKNSRSPKKINFKVFKVMKSTSKPSLAAHYLFSKSFNDKF